MEEETFNYDMLPFQLLYVRRQPEIDFSSPDRYMQSCERTIGVTGAGPFDAPMNIINT